MGTWEGHISPGVAFYSFGILYCFQISYEYVTKGNNEDKKTKKPNKYSNGRWKCLSR